MQSGCAAANAAISGRKSLPEKQLRHRQTRAIIGGVASAATHPDHVASPLGYVQTMDFPTKRICR